LSRIFFEKIDSSSSAGRDLAYFMGVLLLFAGVLVLANAKGKAAFFGGAALIVSAVSSYVRLLRKTPALRYFRYFWLDQDGVHHIEGNSPTDRVAHFSWNEIESAEASASGDDFRGLVLTLKRRGMQGVPILLTMDDAKEAAAAIREAMGTGHHRQGS
jgi:hypothetical protein